ncbi:DUF309 domain-containing protein [Thermodesulfobacteriota bacterium]
MTPHTFHPFKDRLSRDIRNRLSKALMVTLDLGNLGAVSRIADEFLHQDIAPLYHEYIRSRLDRYQKSLEMIIESDYHSPFFQALVLWDQELFFEVHERLEEIWMKSQGAERLGLQAMIRAAGYYVHLAAGNGKGAEKMAQKACPALLANRHALPSFPGFERLMDRLRNRDPATVKLLAAP